VAEWLDDVWADPPWAVPTVAAAPAPKAAARHRAAAAAMAESVVERAAEREVLVVGAGDCFMVWVPFLGVFC
jgi:hypothetical protein